jgi:hypothetical protein
VAKYEIGQYKAVVTKWDFAKAKSGNLYWYYMVKPVALLRGDEEVEAPDLGERMIRRTFGSSGALAWLEGDLKKMGIEPPIDLQKLDPTVEGGYDLEGVEVVAEVDHKESDQRPGLFFEEWKLAGDSLKTPDRPSREELDVVLKITQDTYNASLPQAPEPKKKPAKKAKK